MAMVEYVFRCESCTVPLDREWPVRRYMHWVERWMPDPDDDNPDTCSNLVLFQWVPIIVRICPFCWVGFRTHLGGA